MKGVLFTGIVVLIMMALYFKFLHKKIVGSENSSTEEKSYGYDSENYGYED